MATKRFSLIIGVVMLALGAISLIPGLEGNPAGLTTLNLDVSYGLFLGLFPMNILNKLALIFFGSWGLFASRSPDWHAPVLYARTLFFTMLPLAVLGIIPATDTLFGYWPLYGNEVIGHTVFGLLGGYFGFFAIQIHRTEAHT